MSIPQLTFASVLNNPSVEVLKEMAKDDASTTEKGFPRATNYGSSNYVTDTRSRSAKFTRSKLDGEWLPEDEDLLKKVQEYAKTKEVIQIDCIVGEKEAHQKLFRVYISKEYPRLAQQLITLVTQVKNPIGEPDFVTYDFPEWEHRAMLIDVENGKTLVLGSDYFGEVKKSFLRQDMYTTKLEGGLGLHAGSKQVVIKDGEEQLQELGQLYFGLSATGKSTLTGHGFWLDGEESTALVQDDVVRLMADGECLGTEGEGLFIKTDGISDEDQPELYRALVQPGAILENVTISGEGVPDFDNVDLTKNGRAIILRDDLVNAHPSIDLKAVHQVFFITRNPLVPPICRLTKLQAAIAFVLGESVESSAGDPTKAGQSVRVVGTNPFIVGPKGEEGNRFLELLEKNPQIECYILNTGGLGEGDRYKKITLRDTVNFLVRVSRGTFEWEKDEVFGIELPHGVAGSEFDPRSHYSPEEFEKKFAVLQQERKEWLAQFPTIREEIKQALY